MPRRKIRPNLDVDITWDDVSNKPSLVTGSGTTNTIPKFTGTNAIGNSVIYESSNNVGIGTTNPGAKLHIIDNVGVNVPSLTVQNNGARASLRLYGKSTLDSGAASANLQFFDQDTTDRTHFVFENANIGDPLVVWTNGNRKLGIYATSGTTGGLSVGSYSGTVPPSDGMIIPGNVGIGTTSPNAKLHVYSISSGEILLEGVNKTRFLAYSGGSFWIQSGSAWTENSTADIHFSGIFGSPIHMTIQGNTGNVGIGTTNPGAKLAVIGGVNVGGTTNPGYGNLYVLNNCSADSFTDRTKGYDGDALTEIKRIKNKDGEIDHDTLPEFVKKEIRLASVEEDGRETEKVTVAQGRDIGAMVTMLTVAIQQIANRLERLEEKLNDR